jgi:hypothetical protein
MYIMTVQLIRMIISIQINHQLDATIPPVYYLAFIYSSTCFGRPHGHHQLQ